MFQRAEFLAQLPRKWTENHSKLFVIEYMPLTSLRTGDFLLRERIIFRKFSSREALDVVETIYNHRSEWTPSYSFINCKNNSIHYESLFRTWCRRIHGLVHCFTMALIIFPVSYCSFCNNWNFEVLQTFKLNILSGGVWVDETFFWIEFGGCLVDAW